MALPKYLYLNITTNTTTVVHRGSCTLHSITINTKGATANTITVYDNVAASGTKVATIDDTTNVGTLIYDAYLTNGLTIVTATGTPADITVVYIS